MTGAFIMAAGQWTIRGESRPWYRKALLKASRLSGYPSDENCEDREPHIDSNLEHEATADQSLSVILYPVAAV